MPSIDTTLTNTILVPSADSLVSGHPLADTEIGTKVGSYNQGFDKTQTVESSQFQIYIVSGGKSVPAGFCENIENLKVNREVETKRSGGNGTYAIKLPGVLSYAEVKFNHFYCDSDVFMNWLINGANQGGIQKADIEIHIGGSNSMVYTLRDAFPTEWFLGTMSVNAEGLITQHDTLTYSIDANKILVENVTIVYGRLDYQLAQ